jgi:putative colanic acid biosynthesis acetyltransferase WcaB
MSRVFCDWEANRGNPKGQLVLALFRLAQVCRGLPDPWWLLTAPYLAFYRINVEWILGIELRYKTKVGPGVRLFHGMGLVVHEGTVFGARCVLRQNTTIGNKSTAEGGAGGCPVIGDEVDIGANAVVLGPIRVGDGAVIGAGSVVVKDVPPGATVVGNPARIVCEVERPQTPEPTQASRNQC